jgi:DNA polymerase-4
MWCSIHSACGACPVSAASSVNESKQRVSRRSELRHASDTQLWPIFGPGSTRMRERAAGIDERPVIADWDEQSISAEETFATDIGEQQKLQHELATLADRATARLRAQNLLANCVTVKIRRADFRTYTRQHHFEPSGNDSRSIAALAARLLDGWFAEQPRARVRLLGVGVSQLTAANQLDLFAAVTPAGASPLDATMDKIRERFGTLAVRRGSSLPSGDPD